MVDFENLPDHALLSILMHSDYKSLQRTKVLSKLWLGLVSPNQEFWRQKFELDFWESEWEYEDVDFEERYKIEYGWRIKEPRVANLGVCHVGVHNVKVNGSKMVCGTVDGCQVWDIERMECVLDLKEKPPVWSIACDDEMVFLGGEGGEIRAHSLAYGELWHEWKAHDSEVGMLFVSDGRLMSRGRDCIMIWDASAFHCLRRLPIFGVDEVYFYEKEIICGLFRMQKVFVASQEDPSSTYILDVRERVTSVCANSKHIFVGCEQGSIQFWDKGTKGKIKTLDGGGENISSVWCNARKFISVSYGGCLGIWDAITLTCSRQMQLNVQCVQCVDCDKGRMAVGLEDRGICVLDFGL